LRETRKDGLAVHPLWRRFLLVWKDAKDFAAGRRLHHPFRQRDKDAILNGLGDGPRLLDGLVKLRKISLAEAGLLKKEFDLDVKKIRRRTAIDPRFDTGSPFDREEAGRMRREADAGRIQDIPGFHPMPVPTGHPSGLSPVYPADSVKAIRERLPLLERIAHQETLHPEVLERVLGVVEKNLRSATIGMRTSSISSPLRDEIEALLKKTQKLLIRIKER
jgi:hypothetical protein